MTVPKHPMAKLKGTKDAKDLMDAVRAHKKPAAQSSDGEAPPADEKAVAARFIQSRAK